MTKDEAQQLQINDLVFWNDEILDTGVVISKEPNGIGIRWNDYFPCVRLVTWKELEKVSRSIHATWLDEKVVR